MSSALVTGASGFLGSALARCLAEKGVSVYALVRPSSRLERLDTSRVTVVAADTGRADGLQQALDGIRADYVFHLASYGVSQAERDPQLMCDGNAGLVCRLLEAIAGWKVRKFIQTGSCSEYAPAEEGTRIGEEHPIRPMSLYGAAKAAAVGSGRALAKQMGLPFLTLRPFMIFGPGEAPERLVPYLIAKLSRDQAVDLTAGEQKRDLVYVEDAAEAFYRAAQSAASEGALNVCSGRAVRVRAIAEAVADAMGKPRSLLRFGARPYREDEPMWLVGDPSRMEEATGWRARAGLAEGIERMVARARQVPA
ncbi:MAG TPA: NAD(P)-dependent oxidoreductase [Terriglobales bacterium]|jgi:nucleoside-diphosphate-sugar epimerase|nr:NAD(P)-dependent oxidoreductase [Terriglobales bacterium]